MAVNREVAKRKHVQRETVALRGALRRHVDKVFPGCPGSWVWASCPRTGNSRIAAGIWKPHPTSLSAQSCLFCRTFPRVWCFCIIANRPSDAQKSDRPQRIRQFWPSWLNQGERCELSRTHQPIHAQLFHDPVRTTAQLLTSRSHIRQDEPAKLS